jgi:phage FluMu protein gp41
VTADALQERLRYIGGEMYAWSDQTRQPGPAGGAMAALLGADVVSAGDRVLVVGPHDHAILRHIVDLGGHVTWLTRSLSDAKAATKALDIEAYAGSLAALPSSERFDVVVALDGLDRLCSAEHTALSWDDSLEALIAALAPTGRLLIALTNPIGIQRFVQPEPWYARRDDSAWLIAEGVDPSVPENLDQFVSRLGSAGFQSDRGYATFPTPARPAALVSADLLDAARPAAVRRELAETISGICLQGWRDEPLVREPQLLVSTAIRGGIGVGIAASWVLIASRGTAAHTTAGRQRVVINDEQGAATWNVTYELTPRLTGGWTRRVLRDRTSTPMTDGDLRRDPDLLNDVVHTIEPFTKTLIAACMRHDHLGFRQLIRLYAGWLNTLADDRAVFAMPGNVTLVDGSFALIDPSWRDSVLPAPVLLAKALRSFAVELLVGGYNHPWPATMDADRLTIVLGAIAGSELDISTVDAAVAAEARIRIAIAGTDADRAREIARQIAEAGSLSGPIGVRSFQQLRSAHARQAEKIERLEDKLQWLDHLLASRERALRIAQTRLDGFHLSITYRVGRIVLSPLLVTRKAYQRFMGRLRNVA